MECARVEISQRERRVEGQLTLDANAVCIV
jgi:hypothetical protein